MAFRQLTEADCGQPNPLVRLASHLTRDHAFAETHGQGFPTTSERLVEEFWQETRAPQTFRMNDLMREMHEIESQRAALPPVPASAVKDQLNDNIWALQYIEDGRNFSVNDHQDSIWGESSGHRQQQEQQPPQQSNVNLNEDPIWADQYLQQSVEATAIRQSADELLDNVDDPQFQYSKFLKFLKTTKDGVEMPEDADVAWVEGEAAAWSDEYVRNEQVDSTNVLANVWSEEVTGKDEEFNRKMWDRLQDEWKKMSEIEDPLDGSDWVNDFNLYYDSFKEYKFSEENPMFDVLDPLARGKEMLIVGDIPSAVLCFEAAVKKEPENTEAWQLLGTTQAENEQDPNAICALKRSIELQPDNLTALMALAVCFTNENYHRQACQALVSWLKHNSQYASLVPPDLNLSGQVASIIEPTQLKVVQDLYIRAAQQRPQNVDYEVQCGLGVLFNISGEYNKAVDCFKSALSVKPEDAKLWNRLGATLANASRVEEALDAYHKALDLEPGLIRARYNVGIACINLNAYKEAVEHFLVPLNQQARGKDLKNAVGSSQMSEAIWSTLRMVISLMNRPDLRPALDNRDLDTLNRAFNIQDN